MMPIRSPRVPELVKTQCLFDIAIKSHKIPTMLKINTKSILSRSE